MARFGIPPSQLSLSPSSILSDQARKRQLSESKRQFTASQKAAKEAREASRELAQEENAKQRQFQENMKQLSVLDSMMKDEDKRQKTELKERQSLIEKSSWTETEQEGDYKVTYQSYPDGSRKVKSMTYSPVKAEKTTKLSDREVKESNFALEVSQSPDQYPDDNAIISEAISRDFNLSNPAIQKAIADKRAEVQRSELETLGVLKDELSSGRSFIGKTADFLTPWATQSEGRQALAEKYPSTIGAEQPAPVQAQAQQATGFQTTGIQRTDRGEQEVKYKGKTYKQGQIVKIKKNFYEIVGFDNDGTPILNEAGI